MGAGEEEEEWRRKVEEGKARTVKGLQRRYLSNVTDMQTLACFDGKVWNIPTGTKLTSGYGPVNV